MDPDFPRICIGTGDGKLHFYEVGLGQDPQSGNKCAGGCRQLQLVDVQLQQRKIAAKKAERSRLAAVRVGERTNVGGTCVISSKPSWSKTGNSDPMASSSRVDETFAETSSSIVSLFYLGADELHEEDSRSNKACAAKVGGRYIKMDPETALMPLTRKTLVLVCTPSCLMAVSAHSYDLQMLQDLHTPLPSQLGTSDEGEGIIVSTASCFGANNFISSSSDENGVGQGPVCVVSSAFDAKLSVLLLDFRDEEQSVCDSAGGDNDDAALVGRGGAQSNDIKESDVPSLFPKSSLPSDSALLKSSFSDPSGNNKTSGGGGNRSKPKPRHSIGTDKPVTFHTRIRSSGYGSGPPPIPLGGRKPARKSIGNAKQAKSHPLGVDQEYPVDCDMIKYWQSKHDLPEGASHSQPILKARYSPDGQNLVTATVDGSVRVLKLPLSKHRGDGNTYMAHRGKVHHVEWSNDKGEKMKKK